MAPPTPLVIAIDGPAAAGKSTIAQKLALRLGLMYVDSGATYRAAALKALEDGVAPGDERAAIASIDSAEIGLRFWDSRLSVTLNGRDVTEQIRTPEVTLAAAQISRLPAVRSRLVALQRKFASNRGVVMEGRDIGTVVFPDAPLKIFLTARPEERARRRLNDEIRKGRGITLEETASEIRRRDELDVQREVAPLVSAPDALIVDSTALTSDQVADKIIALARERNLLGPNRV
ncbi:MAG: (d)CMP kinase [Terriglobia bacterium]